MSGSTHQEKQKQINKQASLLFTLRCLRQVYEAAVADVVKSVTSGRSGAVLMYGATGSGKTWTMMGGQGDLGLVQRSITDLFAALPAGNVPDQAPAVSMSILEIYNEARSWQDCLRRTVAGGHASCCPYIGYVVSGLRATLKIASTFMCAGCLKEASPCSLHTVDSSGDNKRCQPLRGVPRGQSEAPSLQKVLKTA